MKTRKQIMRQAHAIARQLEGDYSARLAMGLKKAWADREVKKGCTIFADVIEGRTAKAIKVRVDMGTSVSRFWLPLSQITLEHESNLDVNIEIPTWLASKLVADNKISPVFIR